MKEEIILGLKKVLAGLEIQDIEPQLEIPGDTSHGDYASNIALIAFSKIQGTKSKIQTNTKYKNPRELAEELKISLEKLETEGVQKIEVAGPGFLNFWVKEEAIINHLDHVLSDAKKPIGKVQSGRKVMVEFTDPNPFKEFHIGHLYSNIVGESLSRLIEAEGADVWRVTYQGDVGLHVAKALYGIKNHESRIKEIESGSLEEKAKFLGQAYAKGATAYEEDPSAKEEIHKLNKMVYEKDPEILAWYEKGREWSLAYFDKIYARLGSKFKKNYFESVAGPVGLALVKEHIKDGIFKESEGAVIFEGEQYGLHSRVFINSLGLPTYEAKDMGLPQEKYKDFVYDESIIITAEEQSAYFKVVLKALSLISPELAAKTRHIAHGVVNIKDESGNRVKMSSRTGNIITGEWLLDEAKKRMSAAYPDMDEETLEIVAIGSIKYALLKSSIGKDISFSFEESISLEGNSGPYLQYSYVRTQSLLAKVEATSNYYPKDYTLAAEEKALLRKLYHFEEIVGKAAGNLSPNTLAEYLFELSQAFNLFYQKQKIVGSEQEAFRLWLTKMVGEVLKKGLDLLGIKSPKKM